MSLAHLRTSPCRQSLCAQSRREAVGAAEQRRLKRAAKRRCDNWAGSRTLLSLAQTAGCIGAVHVQRLTCRIHRIYSSYMQFASSVKQTPCDLGALQMGEEAAVECGAIAEVDPCLALVCRVLTVLTVLNHTHTRAAPRVRTQQSRNVWLATARRRIGPVQLSRVGLFAAGRTVPRRRCECACGSIDRAGQAWWRRQAVPPSVATCNMRWTSCNMQCDIQCKP